VGLGKWVWLCSLGIFVDQPAEDLSSSDPRRVEFDDGRSRFRRHLLQGAVRPVLVIVPDVLGLHPGQVLVVDDQEAVGALSADRADPALRE